MLMFDVDWFKWLTFDVHWTYISSGMDRHWMKQFEFKLSTTGTQVNLSLAIIVDSCY
jgi:hypothetical protein